MENITHGKFSVRRLTTAEEVKELICDKTATDYEKPGTQDHASFFAADNTGFFVGELDGQPISCLNVVKHTDNYAFVGNYRVEKQYRRSGYGLRTWKIAMDSLHDDYNVGLNTMVKDEVVYKRSGFKRAWINKRFRFVASKALSAFSGIQHSPGISVDPVTEVDFEDVLEYTTSVYGFERYSFLQKWVSSSNSWGCIATNDKGKIVGYAIVRTTDPQDQWWKIGPLLADNSQIARSLYKGVLERVSSEDPNGTVIVDVPFGTLFSSDTLQIIEELYGSHCFTFSRMYTKHIPSNMDLKKIFGLTTVQMD